MSDDPGVRRRTVTDTEPSGLIVLGMHRSGTSAMTGALRLCGAWVGEETELTAANRENPKGFWERRDVRAVCDRLLHSAGADWWNIASFELEAIPSSVLTEEQAKFAKIASSLDEHGTWALKEPRLCLLLPFLRDSLTRPICIHIFRNPLEVARSLQTRNGFGIATGLALWEAYNRRALSGSEPFPRVLVSYQALALQPVETIDAVLERLSELSVTDLERPDEDRLSQFIDPALYRRRATEDETHGYLSPSQRELWQHYCINQVFDYEGNAKLSPATAQHLLDLATQQTSLNKHAERERELTRELAARSRSLAELQQRTDALTADLAQQRATITENEATITENEATITENEATITEHEATITAREATIESREKTIETQEETIKDRDTRIHDLLTSSSWKLTAPLRFSARIFKRLCRNLRRILRLLYWLSRGQYSRAIILFRSASNQSRAERTSAKSVPSPVGSPNVPQLIRECQKRHSSTASRNIAEVIEGKAAKISVIAWDMAHNPLGRAYLLADLLRSDYEVEIVGALFPQFGTELWGPLRTCNRVPFKYFPGSDFPDHLARMEAVAEQIDGDILYVSKPRLPSVELAILAKMHRNRPIVLDVDDYEPSFFANTGPLTLQEATSNRGSRDHNRPQAETWTRYCESLIPLFDEITVSNEELRKKFGGTILPHLRSEHDFDPAAYPRDEIRAALGFRPEDRVILFAGTVRMHKGVSRIVRAVKKLRHLSCKLLVIGSASDPETRHFLRSMDPAYARVLPDVPFHDLPGYLCAGDLVCLLQDPSSLTARFQMPAKLTDALAMEIPVLASNAPPLANVAREGLVELLGSTPLETKIEDVFLNYPAYQEQARTNRHRFLSQYSYASRRASMKTMLNRLLETSPSPLPAEFQDLIDTHRRHFSRHRTPRALPNAGLTLYAPADPSSSADGTSCASAAADERKCRNLVDDKVDIVFFWKQNDTGIYGRRQDMLVKYLAKHPRIHRIFHFDSPIHLPRSAAAAIRDAAPGRHSHAHLVLFNTLKRRYWRGKWTTVRFDTFAFFRRRRASTLTRWLLPSEHDYLAYLDRVFRRHNLGERRTIFWVFPNNFHFPSIQRKFQPDLVVADIVDDQRNWAITSTRRDTLETNYRDILGRSDLVFANCDTVLHSMREFTGNLHLFPNAAERFEESSQVWKKPVELRRLNGPIIGYVGNLDVARIDVDLLATVAAKQPTWNLVFLGSMHRGREVEILKRFKNVHFLGVRIYERALQYIEHFDVAMIPHLDNQLTRSMNPLKLYVYLSLHVPVVATPIANIGDADEFVRIGNTPEEFAHAVKACLETTLGNSEKARLARLISRNSWETRVAEMMSLIEQNVAENSAVPTREGKE